MTLLGDASAHAAAAQRSIVERLGDGLGDQASLEEALGDPEALLSDLISPEQRNISAALTAQTTAIGAYVDHVTRRHRRDADVVAVRAARGLVPLPDRGGQGRAGLRRPLRAQRRPGRGRPGPRLRHRRPRAGRRERADPPVVRRARPAHPRRGRRARPVARPHRAAGLNARPGAPAGAIAGGTAVRQVARQRRPSQRFSPPGRARGAAGPAAPARSARRRPARRRSSRARSG